MHLFMEDPESHGARCGNTAKSCQFTTTTCIANGEERERERESDLHSQLSQFNGKYAAFTTAFLHPLARGGGGGKAAGVVCARGKKKGRYMYN